jgi:hypothetical protein
MCKSPLRERERHGEDIEKAMRRSDGNCGFKVWPLYEPIDVTV